MSQNVLQDQLQKEQNTLKRYMEKVEFQKEICKSYEKMIADLNPKTPNGAG